VAESEQDLGKLIAVHGIAPAYLQRAVFIVILSFLFFLAMMFAYYIRQNVVYFLLASAFLVLYLITLFSFVMQRRSVVEVYERGLKFKKRSASWNEVESIDNSGTISLPDGKQIALPKSLNDFDGLIARIRGMVAVK
jgi:Ca2+/Na+ antiporter